MALRANVLAKGFSGIRVETLEALIALLNAASIRVVPSRGSVGASGDLAPLAHLALVLIGEGEALDDASETATPIAGHESRSCVRDATPARRRCARRTDADRARRRRKGWR